MFRNSCFLLILLCLACTGKNNYNPDNYLSKEDQKNFVNQAVRFMYFNEAIPPEERFDRTHDNRYEKAVPSFTLSEMSLDKSTGHGCYLMIRTYGAQKYRATCGRMTVDGHGNIENFSEIAVTPLLDLQTAKERGGFLFSNLVKSNVIEDKYLKMKSYVEWPDARTQYDTIRHQWIMTE